MRVLGTKNKQGKWGSRLIMWALDEPISHVSLECNGLVFHSSINRGVHIQPLMQFLEENIVVEYVDVEFDWDRLLRTTSRNWKKKYDKASFLWLGIRALLKKIFGIKLKKANLWNITGMYICTEWVTKVIDNKEDSDITPMQLIERLK